MPTTTGKFPAKTNRFNCSQNNSIFFTGTQSLINKGSRFSIAAFLLLITAFLSIGCESPGSVGEDIVDDDDNVLSETVYLDDYTIIKENSFSGGLLNTAVGTYDDPVYGSIRSVAFLKPSISTTIADTILHDDTITLQLIFNGNIYGDSLATSNYEIYEAGKIWRGAQIRYNEEVPVDMTNQVGQFQVEAAQDTVVVELDASWKDKYINFFNSDPELSLAERDSIYLNNFPGLAIVPSAGNQNVRFLKTDKVDREDEDVLISRFLHESSVQDDDEEEEEENTGPNIIPLRDWAASFIREGGSEEYGDFFLHNSERALRIQPNLPEDLASKNIVNAQLVFSKNNAPQENTSFVARPNTNFIRAHVFEEDPDDILGEIFTSPLNFSASISDTSDTFFMNVTQYVLDNVYGDVKDQKIYVTIQSLNGLIYSSHFFDPNSDDIRKPRLIITYVEE